MHTTGAQHRRRGGMRAFAIVWTGKVVSLLGTAMTQFALTLWAYGETGRATPLAMIGFSFVTPIVFLGPFIGVLVMPLAALLAGPLSDRAPEPAMAGGGGLAAAFGPLVGTGTGAGMGLLFVAGGLLAALVGLAGYLLPVVRNAEAILPDHEYVAGAGLL